MEEQELIVERIKTALSKIRHHLQEDNGDVEFVDYEVKNRVAVLRFLGNCKTCPLSIMTLRAGIERFVIKEVPEIKRVEAIL